MVIIENGEWVTPDIDNQDEPGRYTRKVTDFRDTIQSGPNSKFPVEDNRYHLYIARSCPWAHGPVLVRALLGLTDTISMDILDPYREDLGWRFNPDKDGCTHDTVNGATYLSEIYRKADPEFDGHVSVPVLWDRKKGTIVNNESIEIMQMLASSFVKLQSNDIDLYPKHRRDEIDKITDSIYETINNGVYRTGFAETQTAYDEAVNDLFNAFDDVESLLENQRYLAGDSLTIADLRLFTTLVRFDEVYHTHFRCNYRRVTDYQNLWGYTRDLYQLPCVSETVNMDHIKEHYYTTHETLNPKEIIPMGPKNDFEAPHGRDGLSGGPPEALATS